MHEAGYPGPVLCDNLEGWGGEGGGREFRMGGDTCIRMYTDHVDVGQKPSQYCKVIILQ